MKVALGHIPINASPGQLAALEGYWRKLSNAGLHRQRFHAGGVNSAAEFIEAVLAEHSLFFIVYDVKTKDVYGECTLNGFMGKTAQIHFSVMPEFFRQSIEITRIVLTLLFGLVDANDDKPAVTTLIGVTPETNRLAIKFIQKVGFKHVITIPDMCNVHGILVPGFITKLSIDEVLDGRR